MRTDQYRELLPAALGTQPADLVLRNGKVIDVFAGQVLKADIAVKSGTIVGVAETANPPAFQAARQVDLAGAYVAPGLMDAHLHLESTMVSPAELVATAAAHGTTTFIVDPHEAANVSGAAGIDYILDQTAQAPANVFVMMPSCVPATALDDNGGPFTVDDMRPYQGNPRILGLGEVMDAPSVLAADPAMMAKFDLFERRNIDGHCPYLPPRELSAYAMAGVTTDHEATTFAFALEERRRGIHVHIREGSAARNLDAIVGGIVNSGVLTEGFSFCTDDKHIEDIMREGHIDHCIRRAVELGLDPLAAVRMATINSARCYGLAHLGAIAPGRQADFVIFDNLRDFRVLDVYHQGQRIDPNKPVDIPACPTTLKHTMHAQPVTPASFALAIPQAGAGEGAGAAGNGNTAAQPSAGTGTGAGAGAGTPVHVIGLETGQLLTNDLRATLPACANFDPQGARAAGLGTFEKIAAVERHHGTGAVGVALAQGYGIHGGAVASSVSHDSHNIIVIGDNDADMARAVNEIIRVQGGYTVAATGQAPLTLPLPIMGLMSDAGFAAVSEQLEAMKARAFELGVNPGLDPFITLSFLALPVIPALRITPRGLCQVGDAGPQIIGLAD